VTTGDPIVWWTGWDVRGGAAAAPNPDEVFAQAPVNRAGADERFELLAVTARGFRPPRFLRAVDRSEESGPTSAEEPEIIEGLRQTWSLLYRRVAETGPAEVSPYAIYLLGVNPPADITDGELVTFNDFYTNVHLPEVAERRHALRAVRYELVREVRPPYRGAPQFLAAYEVDEAAAGVRRHVGPPYATGPDVWQGHTTPWRLWYRRIVPVEA
jgi:hypothetical protein